MPTLSSIYRHVDVRWETLDLITITDDETFYMGQNVQALVGTGCTVVLNPSPVIGSEITFMVGGDWETTFSTISGAGKNIMSSKENLILDTNKPLKLVYQNESRGWVFGI